MDAMPRDVPLGRQDPYVELVRTTLMALRGFPYGGLEAVARCVRETVRALAPDGTDTVQQAQACTLCNAMVQEFDEYPGPKTIRDFASKLLRPAVAELPALHRPAILCRTCQDNRVVRDPLTRMFVRCECSPDLPEEILDLYNRPLTLKAPEPRKPSEQITSSFPAATPEQMEEAEAVLARLRARRLAREAAAESGST